MQLPDGTVLMHGALPYDPLKAHEYYLRTRKLKGRKPGAVVDTVSVGTKKSTFNVQVGKGKTVKLTQQQLMEQRAYAAERVTSIKKKLGLLNAELKKRMAEAKKTGAAANKPPTVADTAKAARDSKKYRDKNQQTLANKAKAAATAPASKQTTTKPKTGTVAELKTTIADVQKSLTAAVNKQRALTAATKNG